MTIRRWLAANEFTPQQYDIARNMLMTGPRATPPSWRAIRKTLGRLRRGDKPGPNGFGSWRAAKSV